MPDKQSPLNTNSSLHQLNASLVEVLVQNRGAPLANQAQIAAAGIEATGVIYTAQASLVSAEVLESLIKTARTAADHFPLLAKVYEHLQLNEAQQRRVKELTYLISADLTIIRDSKIVQNYIEMARIATELLNTIPVPEDPIMDHATTILATGIPALPPPRQTDVPEFPRTTTPSDTSSNISEINSNMTNEEENALYRAEVKNFIRTTRTFEPPSSPCIFHPPSHFRTLQADMEKDKTYWSHIVEQFWDTTDHIIFRYQEYDVPLIQVGVPHRPVFFSRLPNGPVIWGSTKRSVANAIANGDFDG
jgi:hypothetical protein